MDSKLDIDNVPEGEIIGELHSDEEKYQNGDHEGADPEQTIQKKRDSKNEVKQQQATKEDKLMINK